MKLYLEGTVHDLKAALASATSNSHQMANPQPRYHHTITITIRRIITTICQNLHLITPSQRS